MIDITSMLRFLVDLYPTLMAFANTIWNFLSMEIGFDGLSFTVLELLVGGGFTAYVLWKAVF